MITKTHFSSPKNLSLAALIKVVFALLITCLLAAHSSIANSNDEKPRLDYADIFNIEYADNPQYHPSGDYLIYERVSMDKYEDKQTRSLWRLNPKTKRHAPLISNIANSYNGVFSKDGKKIAFLSSIQKGSQIFVYDLVNKDLIQITQAEQTPSNIEFSHDAKHIAFTQFTPIDNKPLFSDMPKAPKGANWSQGATVIDAVLYRADGGGYAKKGFTQIYTVAVDGGTAKQLTSAHFNHNGPLAFSAESKLLYFSSNQHDDWELHPLSSDIYAVNTSTSKQTKILDLDGPQSAPSLSPNGKYLAFLHTNDRKLSYQVNQIMLLNLKTKQLSALSPKLDRQIQDLQWLANSKALLFSYADNAQTKLAKVSLSGKITNLNAQLGSQALGRPYISGDFTVSTNEDIVFTRNNAQRPADLYLYKGKKAPLALTQLNEDALAQIALGQTQAIQVNSSVDGLSIDAWIAYPPNFDANNQYPLILEIHGGPHAAYSNTFSLEIQLMAAKGYVVVWSNPRGSSSYGEDFGNTIHHNYPSNDYHDLMDVVDATIAKGSIDSNNLFVTGGSGGGVLTAWIVGKTDRFKAAVVAKPVINWLSFALTADAYPFFSQYWMPGLPWEIHEHLWKYSPLSLVGNVSTPTMLLTGEADYRTPISETEQYYQALKLAGVPTAMVRIPGASHSIAARPTRLMQKIGNILAWFEKYKSKEQ